MTSIRERSIPVSFQGKGSERSEYQVELGCKFGDFRTENVKEEKGGYVRFITVRRAGAQVDLKTDHSISDRSNHNYGAGIDAKAGEFGAKVGGYAKAAVETGRSMKQENKYEGNCDWIVYEVGGSEKKSSVSGDITLIIEEVIASPAGPSIRGQAGLSDISSLVDFVRKETSSSTTSSSKPVAETLKTLHAVVEKSPMHASKFARVGGIQTTVTAMEQFPSDVETQTQGIRLLGFASRLDFTEPGIAAKIEGSEVIVAVIKSMKRHSRVPEIQQFGCNTLFWLAPRDSNKTKILAEKGVTAMRAALNLQDEDVVASACNALDRQSHSEKFTRLHVELESKAFRGVFERLPTILRLLMYTENDTGITTDSRLAIADDGGVDEILSVMAAFPDSVPIQLGAMRTLHGLAYDKNLKGELLKSPRVRRLVAQALERHQHHPALQSIAADVRRVVLSDNTVFGTYTVLLVAGIILAWLCSYYYL